MTEAQWCACENARELLRHVRTELKAPATPVGQRKLWLFGCAGCRLHWNELTDKRSRAGIEFAERIADGQEEPAKFVKMYLDAEEAANRMFGGTSEQNAALNVRSLLCRRTADDAADAPGAMNTITTKAAGKHYQLWLDELRILADLLRDIFGNPFRPVAFAPEWRTDTAIALARTMYETREFSAMPILADALQDAGCDSDDILNHCRDAAQVHVRGCWVCDLVLGKE